MLSDHVRPEILAMAGYTPGEQPRAGEFVKLNTNENPYPPSPSVVEAVRAALTDDGTFRKYPDPTGAKFRRAAAELYDVDPDGVVIGNGSDDILTVLTRAFVPQGGLMVSPAPSYSLYSSLAEIQGARFQTVPFQSDWTLPTPWPLPDTHLTLVANPNSPSGTRLDNAALAALADRLRGPLVVDEAYADFAGADAIELARRGAAVVTRTLSKSYALAGLRFGFALTTPDVARQLNKVRDSYNCDALALAAATAALGDRVYFQRTCAAIVETRGRLERELSELGYEVTPSRANFVWARRERPVKPVYEELKRRRVLVRYMDYPGYGDGLRVTVGTDAEIDRLLQELRDIG